MKKSLSKKENGLESKKGGVFEERPCDYCGVIYRPKREWQRYHTPRCRKLAFIEKHKYEKKLRELEKRIERLESKMKAFMSY